MLFVGPPIPAVAPTLISPSGTISETTPIYIWQVVDSATWYHLWDGGPSGPAISQWYQASEVCDAGTGTCGVESPLELEAGDHRWWVKSWNPYDGTWSDRMDFTVSTGE